MRQLTQAIGNLFVSPLQRGFITLVIIAAMIDQLY